MQFFRGPRQSCDAPRVFCDIHQPDGEPYARDPRGVLKRVLKRVEEKG